MGGRHVWMQIVLWDRTRKYTRERNGRNQLHQKVTKIEGSKGIQWNADGIATKKDELAGLLEGEKVQVALTQESKLAPKMQPPRSGGLLHIGKTEGQAVRQVLGREDYMHVHHRSITTLGGRKTQDSDTEWRRQSRTHELQYSTSQRARSSWGVAGSAETAGCYGVATSMHPMSYGTHTRNQMQGEKMSGGPRRAMPNHSEWRKRNQIWQSGKRKHKRKIGPRCNDHADGKDRRGGSIDKHGWEIKEPNSAHEEHSTGCVPRQSHTEGGGPVDEWGDPGAEEKKK